MKENLRIEHYPDGMTETQVVAVLTRVSARIAKHKKYVFDGHEEFDIVQRGIYEGLRIIAKGKYNPSRGKGGSPEESLERFMSVHIRRRLSNYKRDMLRKNNAGGELGIRNPLSLTDFPVVDKEIPDSAEELTHREMIVKIKSVLSATPEILTDFYRVMDGAFVPPQRKLKLRQRIREILEDLQYGVEKED
jgi:hypothetical protein